MKTYKILIPVFNDWESLLILLNNIHILKIDNLAHIKILIIDDCSTEVLDKKIEFSSFKDVEIIRNSKNIGHGKSIACHLLVYFNQPAVLLYSKFVVPYFQVAYGIHTAGFSIEVQNPPQ